ncbi:MAG: ABC transporter permease [Acidimicrobiales bacterium]|jgi:ribose/xylose/arabinose/galactoside ABC-type transport system permease subunit
MSYVVPSAEAPEAAPLDVTGASEAALLERDGGSWNWLRRYGIWMALAVLVLLLSVASPSFRTVSNLTNVLEQNAMLGIVACGMLVMMVSGGFDLSVGAVGATGSVVAAYFTDHGGLALAIVACLVIGIVVGLLNGLLIAKGGINAFMTTFAMASIVTGILFVVTSAAPVNANAGWLTTLALGEVGRVPDAFIAYVVIATLTWVLMTRTKWGHYVYSIGGNREASYLSGVPVVASQVAAFVFGGLCAAMGGLILLGQSNIGQPSSATDWPLTAIAICVIAGVSLSGGEGRVQETVAATLLLGVVADGLNLLNVSAYVQPAVTGGVILIAVAFDKMNRGRRLT